MDAGAEYRWNVPIVTYGFDQSFLDYFGTNGVRAVESAIQVLNDLPAASEMVLTNYPLATQGINFTAQAQGLFDLKSMTLSLLLAQMGLAQPTRNVYVLKGWNPSLLGLMDFYSNQYSKSWAPWIADSISPFFIYIVGRNFDPETLAASYEVNRTLYFGSLIAFSDQNLVAPYPVDSFAPQYTAVADLTLNSGGFYTGLTRDDAGGLRYLLYAGNVNCEKILPEVHSFGPRRAWRPGVEKITFFPQTVNARSKKFSRAVFHFKDSYFRKDMLVQRSAYRVVRQPDFLFSAGDTAESGTNLASPQYLCTGTSNWINNAVVNGNTNGEGPGVIPPQVKITFNKLGATVATSDGAFAPETHLQSWGSFDGSTNPIVVYPGLAQTNNAPMVIHFRLLSPANAALLTNSTWRLPVSINGFAALQMSTDQVNWTGLAVVANVGSVIEWNHYGTENPPKFYRAIPYGF
jgi:hypothetical protein